MRAGAEGRKKAPRSKTVLTIAMLIGVPVLGILIAHVQYTMFPDFGRAAEQHPAIVRAKVEQKIGFTMSGGQADLRVDLARPPDIGMPDGTWAQRKRAPILTSPPAQEIVKFAGQSPWEWFEWDIRSTSGVEIVMLTDFETHAVKWDLKEADADGVDAISAGLRNQYIENAERGREWLGSDGRYKIDPTNVVIASKAREVAGGSSSALGKATAIFRFLKYSMEMTQGDIGAEPTSSLTTLEAGGGDCDEIAFLLISMLRSIGIPAWAEFGIVYLEGESRWVTTAWVQVALSRKGGGDVVVGADLVRNHWLFRSAGRLTAWVDDGDGQHMLDYYQIISYQYAAGTPSIFHRFTGIAFETEGVVNYYPP